MLALGAAIGACALVFHTVFYSSGWQQRARVRADLESLRAENAASEQRVEQLRRSIVGLRTRPEVQKRVARHGLGYVRPGELILEVEP